MVLISRGWKPIISSKKGQFTSESFKKKIVGPWLREGWAGNSPKTDSNDNYLDFLYFKSWAMLSHSLSTREKSRFDIINPASCSTIKQQPLLNWNYYLFNLLTSHNRNIIKEFSGRLIILGWVQAFLVLDGWNRFVVKVFKAIFC